MALTKPVVLAIMATVGTELLHVPPASASVSKIVLVAQVTDSPLIGAGNALTDTVLVVVHPDVNV